MDKLDDVRQVKVEAADVTGKLALALERHIWSSAQVGGSR